MRRLLQFHPAKIALISMTLFCVLLSLTRVFITHEIKYLFLNWNLFLAIIPFGFTSYMIAKKDTLQLPFLFLVIGSWLLFFPNSPYIFTDLLHLHDRFSGVSFVWFDLLLILSFAWTAILFGFLSLKQIHVVLKTQFAKKTADYSVIILLFIASYGVYLGRYLRWNSWDIITHPLGIMSDIWQRFINPFDHPRTWGMTIIMGILLNMMYWGSTLIGKTILEEKMETTL
jgi:uncharacterized membrane protein